MKQAGRIARGLWKMVCWWLWQMLAAFCIVTIISGLLWWIGVTLPVATVVNVCMIIGGTVVLIGAALHVGREGW